MSVRERDASGQHMTGDITYTYLGDGTQTLQSIAVGTGRLEAVAGTGGALSFVSNGFITDHLGNVAAVVNLSASSSTSTGAFILELRPKSRVRRAVPIMTYYKYS